jgi:hypothetical protein
MLCVLDGSTHVTAAYTITLLMAISCLSLERSMIEVP